MSQLNLSARAFHRMQRVKLARTIADLAGSVVICPIGRGTSVPAEADDGWL